MRFWLPPLNTISQQMVILNGRFAQDMRSPSPRVFLSALHTLNAPRHEVTQRTPFVWQHNLLFCSKGAKIIGAAKRYLNALPPVMDLILGRITPRSYCHKATQRFREPFSLADAGGDHPGAGRTKPPRRPLRGAEPTWGRAEGRSCTGPPLPAPFWGRDAGRSPRASHTDEARTERDAGLAGGCAGPGVCAKAGGRGIHFFGVHRGGHPLFATSSPLLCWCISCRGVCQLRHANLCV